MKRTIFNSALFLLIFILFPVFLFGSPGDGSGKILPSGWEFTPNGSSHIIAVTTTVNFNCVALTDGDYIGVFYTNDQGTLSCGGAFEYATGVNQVLAAYGDDITTIGVKDGFEEGELMTWKVYFSQSGTEQEVLVFYNNLMPNFDGLFMTNGVSALTSMLNPMALQISATPEISCSGESVQLNVMITGGCGTPYFEWSSEPAGFSSNLQNPVVNPVVSTTYTVVVSNQYGDSQTDSVYVEIIPLPEVVCPPAMEACQGDAPVLLDAATPTGGIYTGTGVVFDNGNYYFVPETGIGDFQITYCYIDPLTGCENCCSFIFTVHPLPQVTCPMDMTVCDYSSPFALTGATPEGGNYSGTGVGSGIFDPSIAGAGDHVITYSYTDPDTGCSNSCNFIITVISVEVTCPENLALCLDAEPVILTGGLPDGGVYTGTGVADGIFYPSVAGAGQHTLTYTWTYPGTNCFSSCEFIAEVYPLPQLSCPDDFEVCLNSPDVLLDNAFPVGGVYSGTGVYFENGDYFFEPFIGEGSYVIEYCYTDPATTCSNCCEFTITVAADQIIELPAGWSGISSFLLPDDPELNALLYPITYPLVYLSNFEGVYWPGGNVFTLDTWNVYSGYTIKVEWETQLPVCGDEVQNKIVNLNSGWNLIPVFSSVPVDIESLFGGLSGFQIAKDGAGLGVYWPQFGINTLGVVKPGKAYFVRMTIPGSIDFSSASKIKSAEQISWSALPETPWNKAHITPGSHLIAFTMNETPMLTGDIVGAFDSEGICCGVAEVHDKSLPFVLQAYADDIFENGKTGFETGELLQFQLYRPATGEIFDLNVSYNSALNEGYFEHHGLSEIITVKLSASGMPDFDKPDISFYPNPTSGILNITGEKSTVNLTVMNALGARVFAGELNLPDKIDLTNQPKGVYLLRVNTHDQVIFKKIVIR